MGEVFNLADSFTAQACKTPQSVAIVFSDQTLTYRQLDERSDKLAGYLQGRAIGEEDLVSVCIERGPEMIVALLGILKAGAAYVPLDPSYPTERLSLILEDTASTMVLSSSHSCGSLPHIKGAEVLLLDTDWPLIDSSAALRKPPSRAGRLAYVIYTSGSTGRPKGVAVGHEAVINLILGQTKTFGIGPDEKILQFSNYCFDASVEQLFLALFNGAALVLFREGLQRDIQAFGSFLTTHRITHLHATPSFLELIDPDHCPSLKRVIAGGETCKKELAGRWSNRVDFYNEYGPTETTVTSIEYRCGDMNGLNYPALPIGTPLLNTYAYILDDQLRAVPEGITGELYIGGAGVGRGYLNRPALTALHFIPDPFRNVPGAKMYKTGDQAQWLPGGDIAFMGRNDEQVKIRGYRVELGEIENVLLKSSRVRQAVVLAREDSQGNNRLIGYVVPGPDYSRAAIRSWLSGKLPEYMVPALWLELESLPVTTNGKLDRRSLPDPASDSPLLQQTTLQKEVAGIWEALLGIENLPITQTFFELGGYSLLLAKLSVQMNSRFGMEIPPALLLEDPTIEKLAAYIGQKSDAGKNESDKTPAAEESSHDAREVSLAQKNFFFHHKLNPHETFPSSQIIMEVTGEIDLKKVEQACQRVIRENEALRTSYFLEKGKVLQRIHKEALFELRQIPSADGDIDKKITALTLPFDLGSVPLIHVFYIGSGPSHGYIYINMPHINSDGATMELIIREVTAIYNGRYDENPKLQFAAYQQYMHAYFSSSRYKEAEAYWKGQLAGGIPLIRFPARRTGNRNYAGVTVVSDLPPGLSDSIDTYLKGRNLTKFQLLLAAYFLLLFKATTSADIPVVVPVHNRNREGFERIMGLLANVLVITMKIEEGSTLAIFVNRCKEVLLHSMRHQEYPVEKLPGICQLRRSDGKRTPITQTFFNYHADESAYKLGNALLKQYVPVKEKEMLALAVDIFHTGPDCTFRMSSVVGAYERSELKSLMDTYFAILQEIITNDGDSVQEALAKIIPCEKVFS